MRKIIIIFVATAIFLGPVLESYGESIREETYVRLTRLRKEKKKQLFDYLERIRSTADSVKSDHAMLDFFSIKRRYYQLQKSSPPPIELKREIEKLKTNIREHYIHRYLAFYDILFVDRNGDIFHTIRKQSDYHKNIFQGTLAETALAKQLKSNPHQTFVDYQYYFVSDEPSAFLIVPVMSQNDLTGWIIFQCAINKINSIFANEEVGDTGEIFLVNKQNYMLTDSRFYGESSILKRHLSNKNITSKFEEKAGHKIVVDYRGCRALTSFEVCHIANSDWLLITKIDEDEIITDHYCKNRPEIFPNLIKYYQKKPTYCEANILDWDAVVVDMDEFRKAKDHENLCTFGVSTCTAAIVYLPGKFSYMAHISNLDKIYGGNTTNLIGNIFKRITSFDIYKYEMRNLRVILVANHLESLPAAINILIDEGVFLSQIKFMYNGQAKYANILHSYNLDSTTVEWKMPASGDLKYQCDSDIDNVGHLLKKVIGYQLN